MLTTKVGCTQSKVKRLSDLLNVFNQHVFTRDGISVYGTLSDGTTADDTTADDDPDNLQQSFQVSFSAGVAAYPTHGKDFKMLYRSADKALYNAKSAGRNRVLPADE